PRSNGIIAVGLADGDSLVGVAVTGGTSEIMLVASTGKAIRFSEQDVRPMGRGARGVRGIKMPADGRVISLIIVEDGHHVLLATEHGYGKRTAIAEFSVQGRGGQGVIAIQTSERNGSVVGALSVAADDEVMLISNRGVLVRTPVEGISIVGRNTQGVTLISVADEERLVGIERIADVSPADDEADGQQPDA
ncbi:MAG: DNA gyrase subunit A, partial [Gammaproteobacteria bacterium]|nr:DNA gyrase subunit A [Gammaproteobacteria bacterium]